MSPEANKAIVRRFFEEYNTTTVDDLLVANYVHHDPTLPPALQRGREAYQQVVQLFLTAFPDLQTTVEDEVAEGDSVGARWAVRGTHRGEMLGVLATGKAVMLTGMSIQRLENGRIAESRVIFDALGLLHQLGVMPMPG